MRIRTLAFIFMLLITTLVKAQDSKFPTLDALANLEIPAFDYGDLVRRLSWIKSTYSPPSGPPQHQVGDRESFMMPTGDKAGEVGVPTELRGMTENVLIWVEETAPYSRAKAQALAERLETDVLGGLKNLFNYSLPPGVDGDPRLIVAITHNPGFRQAGIFGKGHALPRTLFPNSNQREMVVINIALRDGSVLFDDFIVEIIAHEYQHVLLHHRDFNEELWLNEALSSFAEYYTIGLESVGQTAEMFLESPNTGLTHLRLGAKLGEKYGAGALFMIFLAEQYGDKMIERLQAESADGWRGVEKVLRESAGVAADDVFADWALANYFQDIGSGYGYDTEEPLPARPQPLTTLRSFPALRRGSLPQYSTDYLAVNVRGADKLSLQLTQAQEANLISAAPYEGDVMYYGVTTASTSSKLTRAFDLRFVPQAWLEFRIWYDLTENREYAYVEASSDGGETWSILEGLHTRSRDRYTWLYEDGYTGSSGGWLNERIDLSDFARRRILLRFEVLSDNVTTYKGLAIDDLRIDAINFHDGFESADEAWVEEGWIRTDNRLPQRTWLQVVQETPEGLRLDRHMMNASGDITVDLLPGVSQVLIAISPVVPQTSLETEYTLEVNLIDADGNAMTVARECALTTTHALNFRDAPNGDKIGLLPQGTTTMALDKREGWFKVQFDNKIGWISGGYVTTKGDCE